MRFITYNIQYGRGKDGRFDLDRIVREIEGADVVALQEVERYWARSGFVDQPACLAQGLGDYYWVYGPGLDVHATHGPNASRPGNDRRQFGNMLLARRPILATRNHLLPKYASTGPMSLQRSALEAVIDTSAGFVRVYSVHLTHLSRATRLPQIDVLLEVHRRAAVEGGAISGSGFSREWTQDGMPPPLPPTAILMGDFNSEPESLEYERMVGPRSDYGGRITNPEGFVDAWVACGHDERAGATCDVQGRPVRLDFCFVSTALAERIREVRIDDRATGSDHQPVWLDMDL